MAEKGFGVKEINLIGASGTPTIESPNNLNLNAVNVAISTNATIGGNLTVSGTVGIAGTLTYEDVTNVDAVGIVTARDGIFIPDNKKLELGNAAGSGDLKLFHNGTNSKINNSTGTLYIEGTTEIWNSAGSETLAKFTSNGAVQLYHNNIERLRTYNEGVQVIGAEGGNAAILIKADEGDDNNDTYRIIAGNGTNLFFQSYATGSYVTNLKLTGDGNGAVELNYAGSTKLQTTSSGITVTGTLAATAVTGDGSGLTGIAVTEAPVTDYTISANGSSAYRFHGGGVDETANNPDLYLIRGQKYRFNNTTGSGHPFAIREANGGSAYTNGVTGNNQGVQFFTVPYDAPAKIFYQCTIHSGMIGNIYIRGANGQNDNVGITTFSGAVNVTAAITADDFRTDSSSSTFYLTSANDWRFRTTGGTERLRINSSGQVQIGNIASGFTTKLIAGTGSGDNGITIYSGTSNNAFLHFADGNSGSDRYRGYVNYSHSDNSMQFATNDAEALRITSNGDVLIGATSEIVDTKVVISGNINQYNSDTGTGASTKSYVLGRSYTMSTSSTDILTFDNWGTSAFDITVFRRDNAAPAGANVTKIYLAFHGSGTNITQVSIAQESKVTRGSIHNTTFGISENNNTATLTVTGDDNGGETQDLTFYIMGRGNGAGTIVVA